MKTTWERFSPWLSLKPEECDDWRCPDCEWEMILEAYETDCAPIEHGYFYCPHCGRRRIDEK